MTESVGSADVKKTALEGVVGFAVSLFLSTGLLGGSTYLLFGFRDDWRQLSSDRAAVAKEIAENGQAIQTMTAWGRPELQQAQNISTLFGQLSIAKDQPQLDPDFRAQSQRLTQFMLVTLTEFKGDVRGTAFASPILLRYQQSLLGTLDPQIEMAAILRDLLKTWETLTSAARGVELDRVQQLALRQVERQAQYMSVVRDSMAYQKQKAVDDDLRLWEMVNKLASIGLKIALSCVGIVAGIGLLCWAFPTVRSLVARREPAAGATMPRRRAPKRTRESAKP